MDFSIARNFNPIGDPIFANVAAVARDENHIDLFAIGNDQRVYQNTWTSDQGGLWGGWLALGNLKLHWLCNAVAAVSRTPNNLDLFVADNAGLIQTNSWNATTGQWQGWAPVNQLSVANITNTHGFGLAVSAVSRTQSSIDIFVVDRNGYVLTLQWKDGAPWPQAWQCISPEHTATTKNSVVTAIVRNSTHLDVFAIDDQGTVRTTWWDESPYNGQWPAQWQTIGATSVASPIGGAASDLRVSAVARTPDHLDLFLTGAPRFQYSGAFQLVLTAWWDANLNQGQWSDWTSINSINADQATTVAAVSCLSNRLDICCCSYPETATASWEGLSAFSSTPVALPPGPCNPTVSAPFNVAVGQSGVELQQRRSQIRQAWQANSGAPASILAYLEEAFYFVPVYLAAQLAQQGQYTPALDWFRTVYDYSAPVAARDIYYEFELESNLAAVVQRSKNWLLDPLNPHLIAATRRYAYLRYTVISIAQCLCDYADARFTYDTSESDAQARTLYMTALDLLALPIFGQAAGPCDELHITVSDLQSSDPVEGLGLISRALMGVDLVSVRAALVPRIRNALKGSQPWTNRLAAVQALIGQAKRQLPTKPRMKAVLSQGDSVAQDNYAALLSVPAIDTEVTATAMLAGDAYAARVTATQDSAAKDNRDWVSGVGSTPGTVSQVGNGAQLGVPISLVSDRSSNDQLQFLHSARPVDRQPANAGGAQSLQAAQLYEHRRHHAAGRSLFGVHRHLQRPAIDWGRWPAANSGRD